MRTVAAVLALVACVHAGLWALLRTNETAPDFTGQLASVSYAPFVSSQHPDWGERPTVEQIRADLRAIAPYTKAIRTYSATGGGGFVGLSQQASTRPLRLSGAFGSMLEACRIRQRKAAWT